MSGLFGEHSAPAVTPNAQAAADANKGATDLQKLKDKKTRKDTYGGATITDIGKDLITANADTTLASGSLLSLGNTLGSR